MIYTFVTEDGETKCTLKEYHTKDALMEKIGLIAAPPADRKTIFAGTTIYSFPYERLDTDKKLARIVQAVEEMVAKNPLKYFVPQNEKIRDFLNDVSDSSLKVLVAPNGIGKSVAGFIDILLDIIPCDPKWPIFTECGVKWRPYRENRIVHGVGIVTYEWVNHESTIFPQIIQRWTPPEFLGDFKYGGKSTPNWRVNPKMQIGASPVWFHTCSQANTVYESSARHQYWWDEQAEEAKFMGANERVKRRNGRHTMTLTPHKIEGRADTGAGTWIHNVVLGKATYGLNVSVHYSDLASIPDWIFSEKAKKATIKQWVDEPTASGNIKMLREGRARVFGEFHETSGLVFDEVVPTIHFIPPFKVPDNWPKFRTVDHGRVEPCAALCATVSPEGDIIFFREYYEKERLISENVKGIIEASGNKAVEIGTEFQNGTPIRCYNEERIIRYRWTKFDPRSFSKRMDNSELTIGKFYRKCGLLCQKGSGQPINVMIDVVKEFLKIDPERVHRVTKKAGAPRVYFFATLDNFRREISTYAVEEGYRIINGQRKIVEVPKSKDDHLMCCMMMMLMEKLAYVEDREMDEDEISSTHLVDEITAY